MVRIEFTTELRLVPSPPDTREAIQAEVDRVMNELLLIEASGVAITDSALSLNLDTLTVTAELVATGETFDDAARTALSSVRSAIHAAGGRTPGWSWQELDRRTTVPSEPGADEPQFA